MNTWNTDTAGPSVEAFMRQDALYALYIDRLRDLHSAERQQLEVLATIAESAPGTEFGRTLLGHLQETAAQVIRIEQLCCDLRTSPLGRVARGMEGLLRDITEIMERDTENDAREAALIACVQAAEHLEIAGYGTARAYAATLGLGDHEVLLQQSFNEESRTDYILYGIALNTVRIDPDTLDQTVRETQSHRV
ncbi:MAG: DUF892 family protein [Gemmatimonadaceae bacterium]|nr:DUF892 family protein [Gemmatimonadaceae bacterium]